MSRPTPAVCGRQGIASDAAFSLIELVLVVVILGVLAVVAIPILSGIEATARQNAVQAAAANAATGAVADLAQELTLSQPIVQEGFSATWRGGTVPTQLDEVCVVATRDDTAETAEAGPGC